MVSNALVRTLGERRVDWALMLSGFIIGLPVFFQVGLVLLAPVLFTVTRRTGTPLLRVAIPMLAGLSTTHGLIPPHPGPLAAIERLGADPGRTLFYALVVGFPVAVLSGPLFGRLISRYVDIKPGAMADQLSGTSASARPPSLPVTIITMLLPVLLMLAAALAQGILPDGTTRRVFAFAGTPLMAMLIATLLALLTFGRACGFNRVRLLQFAEESLTPIAGVLLVVGAGGDFGRCWTSQGGHRDRPGHERPAAPPVMDGSSRASLRLAVGSDRCGRDRQHHGPDRRVRAARQPRSCGRLHRRAGSLIASHVSDGGFLLVTEHLNMSVPETFATWTVPRHYVARLQG